MRRLLLLVVLAQQLTVVRAPTGSSLSGLASPTRSSPADERGRGRNSHAAAAFLSSFLATAAAVGVGAAVCTADRRRSSKYAASFSSAAKSSAALFFRAASEAPTSSAFSNCAARQTNAGELPVITIELESDEDFDVEPPAVSSPILLTDNDEEVSTSSARPLLDKTSFAVPCTDVEVGSDAEFDYDESASGSDEDERPEGARQVKKKKTCHESLSSGKLWTSKQFPEGTQGSSNFDLANLMAAQDWVCPCSDRKNCIGIDRLSVLELYDHRKDFQTTAQTQGGFRDATRKALQLRFDVTTNSFIRAFKVGSLIDCCAASAGLASGVSFGTWSSARADVRKKDRPWRAGRRQHRIKVESYERSVLNAYIRSLREGMEGPKGGSDPKDKWRTDKIPMSQRWERYKELRLKAKLPIVGVCVAT